MAERTSTDKMEPNEEFDNLQLEEIKFYIQNGNLSGAFERIKDYLETSEYAPLNIAVTGESGTGKSTFINTFLGLSGDKAAKTGVVETTMEPKAYSHPKYKNVTYWDLPGIGTLNFKTEDYLDKVNFADYDFFIIIASERFRECNIKLAQDIQAQKKKFYFVRSKIGQDMYSCKKYRKKSFCEETILEEIRENCLKGFRQANICSPKVFLIDCFEKGKYDFGALQETMEKELPDHKRHVFLMSLPDIRAKTDKMDPNERFDGEEVEEIKSYIQNGNLSGALEKIKDYLQNLENAPLNIAVTGESGSGKSTFVNAFLGLQKQGDKAAKTGVKETTMEPKAYSHPKYKNVTYWDLPGIGTPNFKTEDYLDKVNFADYDFFIIIASERFRESNIKLAQDIQAQKKKFYFVRSKIGQDMYSCKKERKKSFCEQTILEEIREDCLKGFRQANISIPKVFLIDCSEKGKYDFGALQETMEKELPDHKRHVFLMSLPNISLAVLEKKREALRQQIWLKAFLCCAAALPIPGLNKVRDDTLLEKTMREYQTAFGLDKDSLKTLSRLSGKSLSELKSMIKSSQVIGELDKNPIRIITGGTVGAIMLADHLKIGMAAFGALAVGGVSCYVMAYQALNQFLTDSAKDAQRVLVKAWEDQV